MADCSSKFLPGLPEPEVFYGITVKQTDDAASFSGIRIVGFEAESFYLTQNDPNTDEAIVNFRGSAGGGGTGPQGPKGDTGATGPQGPAGVGGAGGFYGITIAESDGDPSFTGINKVNFKAEDFYITQDADNTDETLVQARPFARVYTNFSFETVSRAIEVPVEQQMVVHDEIEVTNPDGELRVEGTVVLEV